MVNIHLDDFIYIYKIMINDIHRDDFIYIYKIMINDIQSDENTQTALLNFLLIYIFKISLVKTT